MAEDISKFPKWARQMILAQDSKIKTLVRMLDDKPPTKVEVARMVGEPCVYLPDQEPIRFSTGSGVIEVRIKGDGLEVSSPCGRVAIYPEVSNVVKVKVVDRF